MMNRTLALAGAALVSACTAGAGEPHFLLPEGTWANQFQMARQGQARDCAALAAATGYPMAIVITERGEGHMVALRPDGLVLDNRYPRPVPWWWLPYTWIVREAS